MQVVRPLVVLTGLLLSILVFVPSPGLARDVFVDNVRGDDAANGQQPDDAVSDTGPVRTIARALRLADQGDRIVLVSSGQPYRESFGLVGSHHSGSPNRPFTIVGTGAVLDGSASVPPDAWERVGGGVFRFEPKQLGHQQLFLDGKPAPQVSLRPNAQQLPKLEPGQWCLWQGKIFFRVAQDKLPSDYALTYARDDVGITLTHVRNVLITDLTVQGYRIDGIQAANDARDVLLLRVTCRGNGRSGVTVGGASRVVIQDSLLGNNAKSQLMTLPWSDTRVSGGELLEKTAPAWLQRGGRLEIDGKEIGANP